MMLTRMPFASSIMNSSDVVEISIESIFRGVFLHANYFTFWYLQDLIVLSALYPTVFLILKNKKVSILVEILAIVTTLCSFDTIIVNSSSFFCFFTGGMFVTYGREVFEKRIDRNRAGIILGILFVTMVIRYVNVPIISIVLLMLSPILVWYAIDIINFP